jgi:hypothetical protein
VPSPVIEEEGLELSWPAPRPWAEILLSKVVDTVEDLGVIARRTYNDSVPGCVNSMPTPSYCSVAAVHCCVLDCVVLPSRGTGACAAAVAVTAASPCIARIKKLHQLLYMP